MAHHRESELPDGIFSLLDTDLYKLTMQSAVLKYFPTASVAYAFTNRTPDMKLNRAAYKWLQLQIDRLGNLAMSAQELDWLHKTCPYLSEAYMNYLSTFKLKPKNQTTISFTPDRDTQDDEDKGSIHLEVRGLWVETILYEIPLLALTSEAYFKFIDKDWSHDGQREKAKLKGLKLAEAGCMVSEFGSRRRRDFHSHDLVMQGLIDANEEAAAKGYQGKVTGTSNVYLAMKFGVPPIGTVAHEWFMGVAALTDDYVKANERGLAYWVATFGRGVLGIALTDTFGTPSFLRSFSRPIPALTTPTSGPAATLPSAAGQDSKAATIPPIDATREVQESTVKEPSFAQVFTGTRQDSGDPKEFIKTMRKYYDEQGIKQKKTIVFSDSLNVDRCIELKEAAAEAGFQPSFGVGTFFTNDFERKSDGRKSVPMNIVIKLSSANGSPAIKISDNLGKNTGDSETVKRVKQQLGYVEHEWSGGDEAHRWDR